MQKSRMNTVLGKRTMSDGIESQPAPKMHKTESPDPNDEILFFKMLPLELRDEVYDYVALAQTNISLHVVLQKNSAVESHAYSNHGLSHTCRRIRREFSLRLERRIKDLAVELKSVVDSTTLPDEPAHDPRKLSPLHRVVRFSLPQAKPPVPALERSAQSHVLRVAERRVSRGVYIEEDIALTMSIPFGGINDHGLRLSRLTITFASSVPRAHNTVYALDSSRDEELLWKATGRYHMLVAAAQMLLRLVQATDWTDHELWLELFWFYDIIFPKMADEGETLTGLKGRSDKDLWWTTLAGYFDYVEKK